MQVLSKQYSKELKHEINWTNEVAVGVGATETIYAAINSYVEPEDEVVVFEPAFDIYSAQVPRSLTSTSQRWRRRFSSKTRAVLLNNPHNPTGKVFAEEELELVAKYVRQYPRVIIISDEVYEHIVFDGKKHVRIASMDGMWERTLTVSSAGKTFSMTGWKVGWAIGPSNLIKGVCLANNWIQFSVATPLQEAVANMLDLAEKPYKEYPTFYAFVADQYKQKRDRLTCSLVDVGIVPITPGGGIFLYSDISAVKVPDSFIQLNMTHDWPVGAFAFCKTDEAIKRLAKLRDS
ncbi:unnamed protein product [Peronospora destructor]|uniref:Aminotransferase class I/classII large domain-containing protein n=1 Tax=Peronospora destructor TaxID=86335 RepID=A0AAV0UMS9_9STRA|nr:unnamed protein product [Peronospora destructor]